MQPPEPRQRWKSLNVAGRGAKAACTLLSQCERVGSCPLLPIAEDGVREKGRAGTGGDEAGLCKHDDGG